MKNERGSAPPAHRYRRRRIAGLGALRRRIVYTVRVLGVLWTVLATILFLTAGANLVAGEIRVGALVFLVGILGTVAQITEYRAYRLGWDDGHHGRPLRDPGHIDDAR